MFFILKIFTDYDKHNKNKALLVVVAVYALLFIIAHNTEVNKNKVFNNKEMFIVGSVPKVEEYFDVKKIDIDKLSTLSRPSVIFFDYDSINSFSETNIDKINKLLELGHAIFFVGYELNPEVVVSILGDNNVSVVPVEASIPIYYHIYGAVYSKQSDMYIPLFYASTVKDEISDNIIPHIEDIVEKHMETEIKKRH